MNRTICCNCKFYPCIKTQKIDNLLKVMDCGIRISLNGCPEFKEA